MPFLLLATIKIGKSRLWWLSEPVVFSVLNSMQGNGTVTNTASDRFKYIQSGLSKSGDNTCHLVPRVKLC